MKKLGKIVKKRTGELVLTEDKVRVSLECIGEGYNGDYNEKDPEDARLLRLDVSVRTSVQNAYTDYPINGWKAMLDSSYCTNLPESNEAVARHALRYIMKMIKKPVLDGIGIKHICGMLSHLSLADFDKRGHYIQTKA